MRRRLLAVLLSIGAIAGFSLGIARITHGGWHGRAWERHHHLEEHVAELCVAAAQKVMVGSDHAGAGTTD